MTVIEHRTTDRYYAVKPTAEQVRWDVENANSVGRVTRWRVFETGDPTFPHPWVVRVHYDQKVADA